MRSSKLLRSLAGLFVGSLCLLALRPGAADGPPVGLVSLHFPLSLSQSQAFARADQALVAAGLTIMEPTSISRGGYNKTLTVLIHCIEHEKTILVDLEAATLNGDSVSMLRFLEAFMKTGKPPVAGGGGGSMSGGFDGDWDSRCFGGYSYKMKFRQEGNRVTATYDTGSTTGTIDGTLLGNTLRFRWSEKNGNKGTGKFTFAADGKSWTGAYSYEDDPDKADRYWNGVRAK